MSQVISIVEWSNQKNVWKIKALKVLNESTIETEENLHQFCEQLVIKLKFLVQVHAIKASQ